MDTNPSGNRGLSAGLHQFYNATYFTNTQKKIQTQKKTKKKNRCLWEKCLLKEQAHKTGLSLLYSSWGSWDLCLMTEECMGLWGNKIRGGRQRVCEGWREVMEQYIISRGCEPAVSYSDGWEISCEKHVDFSRQLCTGDTKAAQCCLSGQSLRNPVGMICNS